MLFLLLFWPVLSFRERRRMLCVLVKNITVLCLQISNPNNMEFLVCISKFSHSHRNQLPLINYSTDKECSSHILFMQSRLCFGVSTVQAQNAKATCFCCPIWNWACRNWCLKIMKVIRMSHIFEINWPVLLAHYALPGTAQGPAETARSSFGSLATRCVTLCVPMFLTWPLY